MNRCGVTPRLVPLSHSARVPMFVTSPNKMAATFRFSLKVFILLWIFKAMLCDPSIKLEIDNFKLKLTCTNDGWTKIKIHEFNEGSPQYLEYNTATGTATILEGYTKVNASDFIEYSYIGNSLILTREGYANLIQSTFEELQKYKCTFTGKPEANDETLDISARTVITSSSDKVMSFSLRRNHDFVFSRTDAPPVDGGAPSFESCSLRDEIDSWSASFELTFIENCYKPIITVIDTTSNKQIRTIDTKDCTDLDFTEVSISQQEECRRVVGQYMNTAVPTFRLNITELYTTDTGGHELSVYVQSNQTGGTSYKRVLGRVPGNTNPVNATYSISTGNTSKLEPTEYDTDTNDKVQNNVYQSNFTDNKKYDLRFCVLRDTTGIVTLKINDEKIRPKEKDKDCVSKRIKLNKGIQIEFKFEETLSYCKRTADYTLFVEKDEEQPPLPPRTEPTVRTTTEHTTGAVQALTTSDSGNGESGGLVAVILGVLGTAVVLLAVIAGYCFYKKKVSKEQPLEKEDPGLEKEDPDLEKEDPGLEKDAVEAEPPQPEQTTEEVSEILAGSPKSSAKEASRKSNKEDSQKDSKEDSQNFPKQDSQKSRTDSKKSSTKGGSKKSQESSNKTGSQKMAQS